MSFDINDYLAVERKYGRLVPHINCRDGLTLSVQASDGHYCSPRDDFGPWVAVEVGYPSRAVDELLPYAQDAEYPTETVYGWVPVEIVNSIVNSRGGLAEV
jgi:hypothetical protein